VEVRLDSSNQKALLRFLAKKVYSEVLVFHTSF
jgi:hypothetical protein